jgi:hypothetical protein
MLPKENRRATSLPPNNLLGLGSNSGGLQNHPPAAVSASPLHATALSAAECMCGPCLRATLMLSG